MPYDLFEYTATGKLTFVERIVASRLPIYAYSLFALYLAWTFPIKWVAAGAIEWVAILAFGLWWLLSPALPYLVFAVLFQFVIRSVARIWLEEVEEQKRRTGLNVSQQSPVEPGRLP